MTQLHDAIHAFELMCTYNSERCDADSPEKLTPYHSVSEPPIKIHDYAARIVQFLNCGCHGVLLGLVLVARHCTLTKLVPSRLTMHRLVLTGTLIAVKCHHDKFASNKAFAKIGGLSLQELNALEILFFHGLQFLAGISQNDAKRLNAASVIARNVPVAGAGTASTAVLHALRKAFMPTCVVHANTAPMPSGTRDLSPHSDFDAESAERSMDSQSDLATEFSDGDIFAVSQTAPRQSTCVSPASDVAR